MATMANEGWDASAPVNNQISWWSRQTKHEADKAAVILATFCMKREEEGTIEMKELSALMSSSSRAACGHLHYYLITLLLLMSQAAGLQCYGCNILQGRRYVDVGCTHPEVITCSLTHKGFKQRFCIKTESMALGMLLASGCATSRHCQQQELPGVRIHCCDSDLCNTAPSWYSGSLQHLAALQLTASLCLLLLL
ncbi:hypothetical protein ACEWY4_012126 [Coilia grayii]|uniref:Uncharacterized protein n=1 Tax=Coilia grayii TaxID=363190 RepID=A0ABD1K073_9TELE